MPACMPIGQGAREATAHHGIGPTWQWGRRGDCPPEPTLACFKPEQEVLLQNPSAAIFTPSNHPPRKSKRPIGEKVSLPIRLFPGAVDSIPKTGGFAAEPTGQLRPPERIDATSPPKMRCLNQRLRSPDEARPSLPHPKSAFASSRLRAKPRRREGMGIAYNNDSDGSEDRCSKPLCAPAGNPPLATSASANPACPCNRCHVPPTPNQPTGRCSYSTQTPPLPHLNSTIGPSTSRSTSTPFPHAASNSASSLPFPPPPPPSRTPRVRSITVRVRAGRSKWNAWSTAPEGRPGQFEDGYVRLPLRPDGHRCPFPLPLHPSSQNKSNNSFWVQPWRPSRGSIINCTSQFSSIQPITTKISTPQIRAAKVGQANIRTNQASVPKVSAFKYGAPQHCAIKVCPTESSPTGIARRKIG